MKKYSLALLTVIGILLVSQGAFAHCQIPCGIYTDEMRFQIIEEHSATIEKSMNQINTLSADGSNQNQLIRWVANKDEHAQMIQDIVSAYFLTQRIKVDAEASEDYAKSLMLLHEMLVYSMKSKQTTDLKNVAKLRASTAAFHDHYFKDKEHDHK